MSEQENGSIPFASPDDIDESAAAAPPAQEAPAEPPAAKEPEKPAEPPASTETPAEKALRLELANTRRQARAEQERLQALFEQRFNALQQQLEPKAPPPPAFDDDPLSATHHEVRRTAKELAELREQLASGAQAAQSQARLEWLRNTIGQDEAAYRTKVPDYNDAFNFLAARHIRRYTLRGLDERQAQQQVQGEWMEIAARALNTGQSPAALLYAEAKEMGYTPKPAKPAAAAVVAAAQAGQAAVTGGGGGAAGAGGALTMERIMNMTDAEFDKITPAQWRKLNGA